MWDSVCAWEWQPRFSQVLVAQLHSGHCFPLSCWQQQEDVSGGTCVVGVLCGRNMNLKAEFSLLLRYLVLDLFVFI